METPLSRTSLLREIRKMRFEEAYEGWREKRLTQEEAGQLLGMSERNFRRYVVRYEAEGLEGLIDQRIEQVSRRRAPVDEVLAVVQTYQSWHDGWNVRHFHSWYRREGMGTRSYSWVKKVLQEASAVPRAKARGKHRRKRERRPLPGMLLHQDGSRHAWVEEQMWDLIVTMDDATGEHTSMFFVEEEGTLSSLHGIGQTIAAKGLFCSLYTDRGSHYFHTPEAGGKVDRSNPTQVGRALAQLGIEHIAAYSPQARGRSERAFATHQERLPRELAYAGITDRAAANRYLQSTYMPRHNAEFAVAAAQPGTAYVPFIGAALPDILCEQFERTVGNDNCVSFEGLKLQIPAGPTRPHYVKTRVRVHRYVDGTLALFHGPRRLDSYDCEGVSLTQAPTPERWKQAA
jgi:hypothetical protein